MARAWTSLAVDGVRHRGKGVGRRGAHQRRVWKIGGTTWISRQGHKGRGDSRGNRLMAATDGRK